MEARPRRVLILAGDTDGNLGDRAIVLSTCEELRRIHPSVRISLVSGAPGRDRDTFRADTIARGPRGLPGLVASAMRSDVVLCGGGGLFQDDTSLLKMPYWALRLALLRCVTRNIVGYSLGVGPLRHASSRLAARLAFACMRRVSVRDALARQTAAALTSKPVRVVADPALSLVPAPAGEAREFLRREGVPLDGAPLVGVAVRRWFHHSTTLVPHKYAVRFHLRKVRGQESCERMMSLLARALDSVVARHDAFILFMPTYLVRHEADDEICRQVMARMTSRRKALIRVEEPRLYKAVTGRLAVMLGGRMHPAIFCAAMGKPVIGLSYNPKFEGFFRLIGLEDRLIRVEEFVGRGLDGQLEELLSASINDGSRVLPKIEAAIEDARRFTESVLSSPTGEGAVP